MYRQSVQRDLLRWWKDDGHTRYGPLRTRPRPVHRPRGVSNLSKPSDLMPELQGRFPIRVELTDLKREDFLRILPNRSMR